LKGARFLHPLLEHLRSIGIAIVTAVVVLLHPCTRSEPAPPPVPVALPAQGMFEPLAEARLLDLVNRTRSRSGLRPLVMTHALQAVARAHSQDMAIRGYVGHNTPEGLSVRDRLARVIRPAIVVGENVATARTADQAHTVLVASPAHLHNILTARFHRVGIGIVFEEQRGLIITEDFSE
jgi:uncharacterized protein YkwD